MYDAAAIIERIKDALGVTRDADLARALGRSKTTLSGWRHRNAVPFEVCILACERTGCPLDWLVLGTPRPADATGESAAAPAHGGMELGLLSSDEIGLVRTYRRITLDDQSAVLSVAREKERMCRIEDAISRLCGGAQP